MIDLNGAEVTYNNKNTLIASGMVAGYPKAVDNTFALLTAGDSERAYG